MFRETQSIALTVHPRIGAPIILPPGEAGAVPGAVEPDIGDGLSGAYTAPGAQERRSEGKTGASVLRTNLAGDLAPPQEAKMGLLDGVLGKVLGGGQPAQPQVSNPLEAILSGMGGGRGKNAMILMAAMALLQKAGGLSGLLQLFQKHGLQDQASSWIGTGANKAITGDVLSKVFGGGAMSAFASQAGIPTGEAGSTLAKVLPELVNQFTPSGSVAPDADDLLGQGMELLKGLKG